MPNLRHAAPCLLALLLGASIPAEAQSPAVAVRSGDHAGFGRVVIDLLPGVRHDVATEGQRLTVRLEAQSGTVALSPAPRAPRNVVALVVRGGELELVLAPGARSRSYRLGGRLVVDIADPVATTPVKPAPAPAPATPAAPAAPVATARAPADPDPRADARRVAPVAPSNHMIRIGSPDSRHRAREDMPVPGAPAHPSAAAEAVRPPPLGLAASFSAGEGMGPERLPWPAVTLPFAATTGAAALRRGDSALVVFDERRPVDLSPLRADAIFGDASIALLPSATVLHVPLAPGHRLRLSRAAAGWTVTVMPSEQGPAIRPIRAEVLEGRLQLPTEAPGQVVAVPDPLSGATMLVGTQRGEGQGVPVDRRSPEFALLPTWQGVAVLPLTDALALRPHPEGFRLAAEADRALTVSAPESQAQAMSAAATASRRFDLPALPLDALHRRLQSTRLAAATAPPQARTARRRDVAEAMLALAMGPETQAVVIATLAEDARAAEDPDIAALAAIAALLSGRTAQAEAIEDPRLTGTDEIAFWRAVCAAQVEPSTPRAAAIFGSAMPLLLSYPAPLRDRLLPLALETMARGGEAKSARAVLESLPEQASLDLARAIAAEQAGDSAAALALYDRITGGTDRRARALAAREAVELRLRIGALTPAMAADALERLVFAWRGDGIETALRFRVAELRAAAGSWRTALALLRELRQAFPEQETAAGRALTDVFARSLAPGAQDAIAPLDLVALAEENADLLPGGAAGHALADRLADRLIALDLPSRAMPVLEKLVGQAPPGVARATLGGKLAALHLDQGAPQAALAVLSGSVVEGPLPPEVLEGRTLAFARAAAATGDLRTGVGALAELGTPAALALRAALLEESRDWPAATAALGALIRANLPPTGTLDREQSRLVLRLAAAAAQAGDERTLAGLRVALALRLGEEPLRDLANLLSAAPVQSVADLPRAAQEARLARSAPASLRALAAVPIP